MKKKATNENGWQKTFVNVPLTAEIKADIKAWDLDGDALDNLLLKLVEADIRITVSYDSYHQCFSCTLAHTDDKHADASLLLSGKGSTPLKAVKQALYIHWKLLDADWSAYSQQHQREILDD